MAESGANSGVAERLQLLVDAVEEYAIFMLDRDGVVASWNSGAERIKGYGADEIIGRHFSIFYPDVDVAQHKPEAALRAAIERGEYRDEGWRVRRDGSRFWAYVVITAIHDPSGELLGFAKVTRDETERRATQAATQVLIEEAVRANSSKDLFLSRMGHELRTPLNSIIGFGYLLDLAELGPADRECVDQVRAAAQHLLGLLDDVVDMSRADSGRLRLSMEPVPVDDVLDEAIRMVRPLASRRNVRVEVVPARSERHVRADRQRLRQVVLNLLVNALKYGPENATITIDVELGASVVPAGGDETVRITVTDAGPGIGADDLDRLFQPFERLGGDDTIEGSGLGLALSKQLMSAMDGTIGVDSRPGRGSSFWIELANVTAPTERPDLLGLAHAHPADHPPDVAITVLSIEDNPANIRLLERIVELRPLVTLHSARSGAAGLERAKQLRPDLILLDLHLPDMTGEELLGRLRADPDTAFIPITVVSADAVAERPKRLLQVGANAYLTKPLDVERLLGLLDTTPPLTRDARHPTAERSVPAAERAAPPTAAADPEPDRAAPRPAPAVPATDVLTFVHDLNNALGAISNYAEFIATRPVHPASAADLAALRAATDRAIRLAARLAAEANPPDDGTAAHV